MTTDDVNVPEDVIEVLLDIRDSGVTNMFDRKTVARIAKRLGEDEVAAWLLANDHGYMPALKAMGKLVTERHEAERS